MRALAGPSVFVVLAVAMAWPGLARIHARTHARTHRHINI